MNAQMREMLRLCLLEAAELALPRAVELATARLAANVRGFRKATDDEIRTELDYLTDKGLLALESKTVSPENKRWRLTAQGRDFLAEENA